MIHPSDSDGSAFEMLRSPDSPVKPGSTVSFTCSIRRNVNPSMAVLWVKRVGQLTYEIGVNQRMQGAFDQSGRYSATGVQTRTDRYLSVLTIKGRNFRENQVKMLQASVV